METKVYYICGRPRVAVKVASCSGDKYTNFINPQTKQKRV